MTGLVQQFEREATDAGCEVRRVPAADFAGELADLLEPPAVGANLPIEGVSLPDSVGTVPTPSDLDAAATGVTPARFAIAEYGSVALQSTAASDEAASTATSCSSTSTACWRTARTPGRSPTTPTASSAPSASNATPPRSWRNSATT